MLEEQKGVTEETVVIPGRPTQTPASTERLIEEVVGAAGMMMDGVVVGGGASSTSSDSASDSDSS